MRTMKVKVTGGVPLFDISSYARAGPARRDRFGPAEIELISRTVHRAPEVMVKVLTPGATTLAAVGRHVDYVGRSGKIALETDEAERLQGPNVANELIEQWDLDLQEHRRHADLIASVGRRPSRLVQKLVLSMPAGTSAAGVRQAAKRFLSAQFSTRHRYAFVLHTDAPHPHVHVVVKAVSEQGVRIRIDKSTLRRWRQDFAEQLRAAGVEANATDRAVRGQSKDTKHDCIVRAARRGASTHMHRRVQEALDELAQRSLRIEPGRRRLLSTRSEVEAGWQAVARLLREQGEPTLAREARQFVERMQPARTDKEWLAQELLERARPYRTREDVLTR